MARTMTDEQEREVFAACDNDWTYTEQTYRRWSQSLKAELDAERAAHAETKAEVGRLMVALYGDGSSVRGAEDEIAALKARIALAEALDTAVANLLSPQRLGCTLEELRDGVVQMANTQPDARAAADTLALIDALAAWRAAK